MADIISGATFFAPADLENSLTENGVLIAGQSFTGSYGGTVADLGTYPSVTVIVGSEITNPPLKHSIGSSQKLAYKDTKISGGTFAFSGTGTGGGLHMVDGYLYMDNTSVSDCIMTGMGSSSSSARGILYVSGNKHADLNNVVFSGNSTRTGSGYLIWNAKGYLNVTGCTFTENIGSGSGFYANSAGNVFTDTLFSYNLGGKVDDGVVSEIKASGAVFNAQSDGELTFNGCTFTGNTAADGAAAYMAKSAVGINATDTLFIDNMSTGSGGAVYVRSAGSEFTNCYFEGNTGGNGGAIRIYHGEQDKEVTLTGCTFKENVATSNGGVLYVAGSSYSTVVNFTDCEFLTVSDTVFANSGTKQVIFNFAGNNTVNGKIYGYAIVNVADNTKFTFDNDSEISISGLTFAGGATMNFTGNKKVTFAKGQLFTGINVTIDATDYMTAGTYTIAENVGGLTQENISLTQNTKAPYLKSEFGYAGTTLTLTVTDTSTQAALCDPSIEVGKSKVVKVDGVYYSGENYATIHDAMAANSVAVMNGGNFTGDRLVVGSGKTVIFNDIVASGLSKTDGTDTGESYGLVCYTPGKTTAKVFGGTFSNNLLLGYRAGNLFNYNGGHLIIDRTENGKGALFTQNVCAGIGAAIFNQSTGTVADVTGATFSYNRSGGAAVYSNGTITITDSLFDHNLGLGQDNKYKDGAALGIYSGTANLSNVEFTGNTGNYGGAVYANSGTSVLDNVNIHDNEGKSNGGGIHCRGNMTITGSQFKSNKGSNGGAFYLYHGSDARTAAISDTSFTGNIGSNGGAICAAANMTITIDGCVFDSNTATSNGGAIYNNGSITVTSSEFKTATDTIYNKGTLTFAGNITLNAALGGDGTYVIAKDTVFTNAVDLSAVNITVNSALYDGSEVTVATGVAAIGAYTLDNKELMLKVSDNKLILSKMAEIALDDEKTVTGTESNLIASGSAETFIANKTAAAENLLTTIKGGAISNALVGGAYAKFAEVGKAVIGKVELNISDLADVAGKVYAGGYLYGNNSDSAEAQMEVAEVNVTLDGGKVSTNMFGGAHAREYGNANIETVNITVSDGIHGRIYAGGWAEKGAESRVGTSNVIISGGTVDYLYGAGANADGETYVDTTNITIENDAVVNTIFMGGRYGYSYVNTVNLTFAGENKELTRLSGVSSAGMDYANATVVELATDVTADLIDYVDKFVINEDCTLTANNEFYLGDRNNETGATEDFTTFDFIADGEANWTAVAGISDFTNAKFSVNGAGLTTWDGKAALAIGGYSLTYDAKDKTIKLAQITA